MTYSRKTRTGHRRGHIQIPHIVMDSDDYRRLPGNSIKLLNVIVYQYRGRNNGDLTAAFSYMTRFGFRSKETLNTAIKNLLKARLVVRTRQGWFMNPGGRCALYALTWHNIDDCPGKQLEIGPTTTPWRKFSLEQNKNLRPVSSPSTPRFSYSQASK